MPHSPLYTQGSTTKAPLRSRNHTRVSTLLYEIGLVQKRVHYTYQSEGNSYPYYDSSDLSGLAHLSKS